MTTAFFATLTATQPLAWLQQALTPAPRRSVRAISQEVRHLRKGETLVIEEPAGQGVVCLEGALWITHDNDPRDHVIEPGDRHQSSGRTRMMVHALADTRLCLPLPLAA